MYEYKPAGTRSKNNRLPDNCFYASRHINIQWQKLNGVNETTRNGKREEDASGSDVTIFKSQTKLSSVNTEVV